ncbi:ABC transporter substrate-binding protein [Novosphingobium flavum]|uniref:ABC transporter substrate-binding protein n=1 Tax=Novosphingobium flavum TaxID=1778672 RepID=A0A7X1KKZ6_9SPHN|nr:ABC transporter substrate-binding protein [Novosphingobium flavum]MBC2664813.1 ABC transporter substrate-binding protein [Novosphingobium flavum]
MFLPRRDFLFGLGASAAAALVAGPAGARRRLAPLSIRLASNQGVENATLQQLMADCGFARDLALDIALVESRDIAGPLAALSAGAADLCMISAFAGVLPAIEAGQPVRLVGSAMQLPALAVCTARSDVRRLRDLVGKRIGIGERQGLLHLLMIALLRQSGMGEDSVTFVSVGSNAQVLEAVLAGRVDAGPCGVAGLSDPRTRVIAGGRLWQALPQFTYQLAYASRDALAHRGEAVARCLAAYTRLFRFVSDRSSRNAYLAARKAVGGDSAGGEQVWEFIQKCQPYGRLPGLSPAHIAYLQRLNLSVGLQHRVLPFADVADPAPAGFARRLLAHPALRAMPRSAA